MKHLASMGVIQETGADEYKHTNLSKTLTVPKYADGFPCMYAIFSLPKPGDPPKRRMNELYAPTPP